VNNLTANSATLQWQKPDDDGGLDLSHYIIEASVNGGEWTKLGKVDSFSTKFKVADLKTGAKYIFRVSAVNAKGQGKGLDSQIIVPSKAPGLFRDCTHQLQASYLLLYQFNIG
jgi:titin